MASPTDALLYLSLVLRGSVTKPVVKMIADYLYETIVEIQPTCAPDGHKLKRIHRDVAKYTCINGIKHGVYALSTYKGKCLFSCNYINGKIVAPSNFLSYY